MDISKSFRKHILPWSGRLLLPMLLVLWASGCSAPATWDMGAPPCFHESQCPPGFRCVRMVCTKRTTSPPKDGVVVPPVDAGPDIRPPDRSQPPEPRKDTAPTECQSGSRPCYLGPSGTRGIGECKDGVQQCFQGKWQRCLAYQPPVAEVCDGKDNNCDGQTDEGCQTGCTPGTKQICGDKDEGECKRGNRTCLSGGTWGPCEDVIAPKPEECNGKDDDCDGQVDEQLSGFNNCVVSGTHGPCADGMEECLGGIIRCISPNQPTAEDCNDNIDNNCNGEVNEGCSPTPQPKTKQCTSCFRDRDCGKVGGKQAVCFLGRCYDPCSSPSDCSQGFDCVGYSGYPNKYCVPHYINSQTQIWSCSNYNQTTSGKRCNGPWDCLPRDSGNGVGGVCPTSTGKCTVYCRENKHCPKGLTCKSINNGRKACFAP